VGPLTGWLGIVCFIVAMFYVPLAQARQAATGSCRAFYEFRFVWRLVKGRWRGSLWLALLYALLALPVGILKTAPAFFPQWNPALEDATDAEVLRILNAYYFWSSAAVLGCFVLLKLSAARVYAASLLSAVERGSIDRDQLHSWERSALDQLGLLQPSQFRTRHPVVRTATGAGRLVRGSALGLATFVLWFSFVAQIFVSEFFNYHPLDSVRGHFLGGWMNQPLVQLPWFNYTPSSLESRVRSGQLREDDAPDIRHAEAGEAPAAPRMADPLPGGGIAS
jgi:hypothetical protein